MVGKFLQALGAAGHAVDDHRLVLHGLPLAVLLDGVFALLLLAQLRHFKLALVHWPSALVASMIASSFSAYSRISRSRSTWRR